MKSLSGFTKPTDAKYEWAAARRPQNKYYKFDVDKNRWMVYSEMFETWRVSENENEWFIREIIQGYFKPLTKTPDGTMIRYPELN